jgi:enoyl-CoA hydratase/carnithine racemase
MSSSIYLENGLAIVKLIATQHKGAYSPALRSHILQGLAFATKQNAKAILLVNEGICFSAAASIMEVTRMNHRKDPTISHVNDQISQFRKPVIACINGSCAAWGLDTALACHWRIASSRSRLGFPDANVGLLPAIGGGSFRLSRLVGMSHAVEMIGTGKFLTAQEALAVSLVDKVVQSSLVSSNDAFLEEAKKFSLSDAVQRTNLDDRILANKMIDTSRIKMLLDAGKFPHAFVSARGSITDIMSSRTFIESQAKAAVHFEKYAKSPEARALQYLSLAEERRPPQGEKQMLAWTKQMLECCAVEAFTLLEEGASVDAIDRVLKEQIGMELGFFEIFEKLDDQLIGCDDERKALLGTIASSREKHRATSRDISDVEILERCLFPLVNEGIKILETSGPLSTEDLDLFFVRSLGWPSSKGGPLWWAEKEVGLTNVMLGIIKFSETKAKKSETAEVPSRWQASSLLKDIILSGSSIKEELYFKRANENKKGGA